MKLGKINEEILEKLLKNIGKYFAQNYLKRQSDGNFSKFSRQFLEELTKNCTETSNNFRDKLQRNFGEILEIFEALLKICPGTLQSLTQYKKKVFFLIV